jgi:flagellin
MRIQGNWLSLMSWRAFSRNSADMDGSIRKLSAGLRITTAADDVAGLAISENLMVQYRGLAQATRNALDGISLVNTAEGALQEIHSMLQRSRELSLQAANGVLTPEGRKMIQTELDNILREIDRIADTTTFNGRNLLNGSGSSGVIGTVINGLQGGWLEQAARVIREEYGLQGDGSTLTISFESKGPSAAWVSGTHGVNGVLDNLHLHINLGAFGLPGGSYSPGVSVANDRKIARALTVATLARTIDYFNLPDWFRSGVADFIAGRDEQLAVDIAQHGIGDVVNALATPWAEDSLHQSAAYLAVKYLASFLPPDGMKTLMAELSLTGGAADLDTALLNTVGVDTSAFLSFFAAAGPGGGADFASGLVLNDPDVGSIRPGDNESVIPDDGTYSDKPLSPDFELQWTSSGLFDPVTISLQIGANPGEWVDLVIPNVSTLSLGLVGINVVDRASQAIDKISKAVNLLSSVRSELGAMSNRLEVTVTNNRASAEAQISSYSRIRDLDYAKELASLTRQQILVSSSGAMLAQANNMRQHVKWLLNGLPAARSAGLSGSA